MSATPGTATKGATRLAALARSYLCCPREKSACAAAVRALFEAPGAPERRALFCARDCVRRAASGPLLEVVQGAVRDALEKSQRTLAFTLQAYVSQARAIAVFGQSLVAAHFDVEVLRRERAPFDPPDTQEPVWFRTRIGVGLAQTALDRFVAQLGPLAFSGGVAIRRAPHRFETFDVETQTQLLWTLLALLADRVVVYWSPAVYTAAAWRARWPLAAALRATLGSALPVTYMVSPRVFAVPAVQSAARAANVTFVST
jgi:hypothetical protein